MNHQQLNHHQPLHRPVVSASNNHTTSLPWAAAVKAAEQLQQLNAATAANHLQHHHHQQQQTIAFERNNTMGSWSSPETSSSLRSGWNADGSMRGDGTPDDGTAIWGNPSTKKTGIDWAERESLLNPPQVNNNSSEKRIQKPEPTISSINGTEAWGAPPPSSGSGVSSLISKAPSQQQQQQSKLNENSGNTYGTTTKTLNNEQQHHHAGWGDSTSTSSSLQQGNNENSSPPSSNCIWNHLTSNNGRQQKSPTDWLSSTTSSIAANKNNSRIDELNKQFESASLFDTLSSSSSPPSSSSMVKNSMAPGNGTNFENRSSPSSINAIVGGGSGAIGMGPHGNSINDLKQMSANFNTNDLSDSASRPPISALSSSSPSSSSVSSAAAVSSNNNPQSQFNASPLGVSPSRDLLKQMVHQIQLAVQAGHLNAQILNQPMSTPTLQLVYTLLQQIKLLQQLQEVQQRAVNKNDDTNSNLDLQINRVQQNISLLQKAITQQQAALTKNETQLSDPNTSKQQQAAANNYSYANISKLSTNMKVPSNNISNIISNNSMESFKRSNLIDTLAGNNNSDSQRLAQAGNSLDSDGTIDKNLSPLLQSSSVNILNKAQNFTIGFNASQQQHQQQQAAQQKSSLLSAQTPTSSAAAWLAFNSSDLVSSSSSGGWPTRISSTNVSQHDQQQHLNSNLISELVSQRGGGGVSGSGWRTNSSLLSSDGKDNLAQATSASLAPGANLNFARPNSASNNLRQMNESNDILSKNPAYYDWGVSQTDSRKRNFDSNESASLSPPAIGGLSLQSNPWLFAPTSSSVNVGSGMDNLNEKNTGNSFCGKMDNGNADKIGGDAMNFLRSNNMQRSSSALYDWGNIGSSMQYSADPSPIGSKQPNNNSNNVSRMASSSAIGSSSRPAPPPGLMSNYGGIIGGQNSSRSANEISGMDTNKIGKSGDEPQHPSRDSSASLWSGTWFD